MSIVEVEVVDVAIRMSIVLAVHLCLCCKES